MVVVGHKHSVAWRYSKFAHDFLRIYHLNREEVIQRNTELTLFVMSLIFWHIKNRTEWGKTGIIYTKSVESKFLSLHLCSVSCGDIFLRQIKVLQNFHFQNNGSTRKFFKCSGRNKRNSSAPVSLLFYLINLKWTKNNYIYDWKKNQWTKTLKILSFHLSHPSLLWLRGMLTMRLVKWRFT